MSNKIVCGSLEITDDNILSGNMFLPASISMDELPIGEARTVFSTLKRAGTLFKPKGASSFVTSDEKTLMVLPVVHIQVIDPSIFSYGKQVSYYHDNRLIGLFYMENLEPVGKNAYKISCTSAIGLLAKSTHYGGIYTADNPTTFAALLDDIIGGVVPYAPLSNQLRNIPVYGWLPVGTRRSNLHNLLLSQGVSAVKEADGTLAFKLLSLDSHKAIPDSRMYLGGSIQPSTPAKNVYVYEHTYSAQTTDKQETLFDGDVVGGRMLTPKGRSVTGAIILFKDPMHDLSVVNADILESDANYAVLSNGFNVTLTGYSYTHTIRIVSRTNNDASFGQTGADITVSDVTLISAVNSEAVADQMMNYYGRAKTEKIDLVMLGETPGDAVTFNNQFDMSSIGFIQSLDIAMSKTLRASAEIVTGFVPTGGGFTAEAVLTSSGAWTVPQGKTRIRAIIIGGGDGGTPGTDGTDGGNGWFTSQDGEGNSNIGTGGTGGNAGLGGKVYAFTVDTIPGSTIGVSIGRGGGSGATGADTVVTINGSTYSSASGSRSDTGYVDVFSGITYATPGTSGFSAGCGGSGGSVDWGDGEDGEDASGNVGGTGGKGKYTQDGSARCGAGGGGGGGAAYRSNGGNGAEGVAEALHRRVVPGDGGDGGSPPSGVDGSYAGCGGSGGHGGGGGGAGGNVYANFGYTVSKGGKGGKGSPGGSGASGCVIFYY